MKYQVAPEHLEGLIKNTLKNLMGFFFFLVEGGEEAFLLSVKQNLHKLLLKTIFISSRKEERSLLHISLFYYCYITCIFIWRISFSFYFQTLLFFLCVVKQTHGFTSAYTNVTEPFDTTHVLLCLKYE